MSSVKIELNSEGVQELLKCDAMQDTLKMYARDIQMIGDGDITVKIGKKRAYIHANSETEDQNHDN